MVYFIKLIVAFSKTSQTTERRYRYWVTTEMCIPFPLPSQVCLLMLFSKYLSKQIHSFNFLRKRVNYFDKLVIAILPKRLLCPWPIYINKWSSINYFHLHIGLFILWFKDFMQQLFKFRLHAICHILRRRLEMHDFHAQKNRRGHLLLLERLCMNSNKADNQSLNLLLFALMLRWLHYFFLRNSARLFFFIAL